MALHGMKLPMNTANNDTVLSLLVTNMFNYIKMADGAE